MSKNIRQTVTFSVSPKEIYEALMDSKKHAAFTGAAARISPQVGGTISAWDGYIEGKNLELVLNKKIVQEWRASDWPEGEASTATFEITKSGTGSKLVFTQTKVPEKHVQSIKQGWKDHYWKPMKEFFGEQS